jgi:D-alanyl-D-alanine carboxypeptidase/D-alanyl-D-alanine-endopeptidase (penicillin-binding protein 4)
MLVEKIFQIQSEVKYGPPDSGDQSWIFSAPLQNKIWINGTVPAGKTEFEIKGALPDPAAFYALLLKTELQVQGITVDGDTEVAHFDTQSIQPFFTIPSSPLGEWIKEVNQNSFNFYADNILCHLGLKIGKPNVSGGTEVVKKYAVEVLKYTDELSIRDGSGLSPTNAQTVEFQVKLLKAMSQNTAFRSSLAISGTVGTFKNAFSQPELKGKLKGKSGSLTGVLGYTFYFTAKSGKEYAFSLLINHHFSRPSEIREKIAKQLMVWMKEL